MKKNFSFIILLLFTFVLGMAGCGDIYANMKISVEESEIVLYLNEEGEGVDISKQIKATISGVEDENISKKVVAVFDDEKIATADNSNITYQGDEAYITIYPQSAGTTNLYVTSLEKSSIKSLPIKVRVIERVKSISIDSTQFVGAAVGQKINLSKLGIFNFYPQTTNQTDLMFYFRAAGENLVGVEYTDNGNLKIEQDETTKDYFLTASENATEGLVELIVKSTEVTGFEDVNLVKTFKVMIYKGFSAGDIKIQNELSEEISNLVLVENYSLAQDGVTNYHEKKIFVGLANQSAFVKFRVKENLETQTGVARINEGNGFLENGKFTIMALRDGKTSFNVEACVVDENGNVYVSKIKKFDVSVIKVVREIELSTDDTSVLYKIDEEVPNVSINVFESTKYSVVGYYGTRVSAQVSQSEVSNSNLKLVLSRVRATSVVGGNFVDITGENTARFEEFINIKDKNGDVINFGDTISAGTNVYISLDASQTKLIENFEISFVANYQQDLPTFSAKVTCNVCASVGKITSPQPLVIKVGTSEEIEFTTETGTAVTSRFNINCGSGITKEDLGGLKFKINALTEGTTFIEVVEKDTFTKARAEIIVVVTSKYVWLSASKTAGVTQVDYDEENKIFDDTSEENQDIRTLKRVVVKTGTRFDVEIKRQPTNGTIQKVEFEYQGTNGQSDVILGIQQYGDKLTVITKGVEGESVVYVHVTYYHEYDDGKFPVETFNTSFTIVTYMEITMFAWNNDGQTEWSADIYDSQSLSVANKEKQGVGYLLLRPIVKVVSSNREIVINYALSEQIEGVSFEFIDKNNPNNGIKVWASTGEATSFTVFAYINDYGSLYKIKCNINVVVAKHLDRVGVLNYKNDVYLEAQATESSSYHSWELNTYLESQTAYDKSLSLVLFSKSDNDNTQIIAVYSVRGFDVVAEYGIDINQENVPIYYTILNGKKYIVINESLTADIFLNSYTLRIMPSSLLNVSLEDDNFIAKFSNAAYPHVDLTITIGKGTETNPYRISTENDLLDIAKKENGKDKNYELINNIFLTKPWAIIEKFNGSLKSKQFSASETNIFTIYNLYFNSEITNDMYNIGLFGELEADAVIENIGISYGKSNITIPSIVNFDISVGLIAGINNSSKPLENINISPYNENSGIFVNDNVVRYPTEIFMYVGGVVGQNNGELGNISGTANIEVGESTLCMYVGGIAGKNTKQIVALNQNNSLITANIKTNTSNLNSAVGGAVGYMFNNAATDQASILKNYDVVPTIVSTTCVGGIVGLSEANISNCYSFPMFISGKTNVGGAVGKTTNTSQIQNVFVEISNKEFLSSSLPCIIYGEENVGGFGGFLLGNIAKCYVSSFIGLSQKPLNTNWQNDEYAGDIVGLKYVGGFAGLIGDDVEGCTADVNTCFANVKVAATDSTNNGGFVAKFVSKNELIKISCCYAITDFIIETTKSSSEVKKSGAFAGEVVATGEEKITECYAVLGTIKTNEGNGAQYINDASEYYVNTFVGAYGDNKNFVSRSYYVSTDVSASNSAQDNKDEINAFKRTFAEMQNFGQNANTYIGWNKQKWMPINTTYGYNRNLPILIKIYNSEKSVWLFTQDISDIKYKHNKFQINQGAALPTFWTYSADSTGKDESSSFDKNLKMVIVMENLTNNQIKLTDLISFGFGNNSDVKIKVSSSNTSVIYISQANSGFEDVVLNVLKEGTVWVTITSIRNIAIKEKFQICVLGGFTSYGLQNSNGKILNENDVLIVNIGSNTEIYPVMTSESGYFEQFGIEYYTSKILSTESDDLQDDKTIFYVTNGQIQGAWTLANGKYVASSLITSAPQFLFGNAKESSELLIETTLFANLKFYDDYNNLQTYKMLFDGLGGFDFPEINFNQSFKIKVLRGVTGAKLSKASATVENSEDVPVLLTIETDNAENVKANLNNFVKVYKDDKLVENADDFFKFEEGTTFRHLFTYSKIQLTEDIIENWRFEVYNENKEIVSNLTFTLTWQPTEVKTIQVFHYLEKAEYSITKGDNEATTEIGGGRLGVLKIIVSPNYSNYDYIVVSSSEVLGDKISFSHLMLINNNLVATNQYSKYNEDGSLVIEKQNSANGVYYLTTLISAGFPEGNVFNVYVRAYKNNGELVKSSVSSLTSSFAPYITLKETEANKILARGASTQIIASGVTENSQVEFSVTGISDFVLLNPIKTTLNGVVTFNIDFYAGISAVTSDGTFTITAKVTSLKDGAVINTYSQLTLSLADYVISEFFVKNPQTENDKIDGALVAVMQSGYTELLIGYKSTLGTLTQAKENYTKFTGSTDYTSLENYYTQIVGRIAKQITKLNNFGAIGSVENRSVWYHGNTQLSPENSYANFFVKRRENGLGVRGKNVVDQSFTLQIAGVQILSNDGVYQPDFGVDFFDFEDYLENSQILYTQDFVISFVNDSTTEEPDKITTAQELKDMSEGGHYILMNDLTLDNWVPLTTKIASLDGNGYVIHLGNLQLTTTGEEGVALSSVNAGLFEKISTYTNLSTSVEQPTMLTNIILDISRTTWVDLTGVQTVNFGFLAGVNEGGIIYNCEVINAETNQGLDINAEDYVGSWFSYYKNDANKISIENNVYATEIFNQLVENAKTDNSISAISSFIFVNSSVKGVAVEANIGGLVGLNSGYITNSRVGRVASSIGRLEKEGNKTVETKAIYGVNIFAGGTLGGLVGKNSGTIASSYFANGHLVNISDALTVKTITGGLVAYNTGKINTSYSEGVSFKPIPMEVESIVGNIYYKVTINGKTYSLNVGTNGIGTFVASSVIPIRNFEFSFNGTNYKINISDNTLDYELNSIRTTSGGIFFKGTVGGFVHSNYGTIENCYSNIPILSSLGVGGFVYENVNNTSSINYCYTASKINFQSEINGAFTGVNRELEVQNTGVYKSCYYLLDNELIERSTEPAVPISRDKLCSNKGETLKGFVFDSDFGIWAASNNYNLIPKLYQADNIAISYRDVDEDGVLSYSSKTIRGSSINPVLIYSTATFNSTFKKVSGSYEINLTARIISDVNFNGTSPVDSHKLTFVGELQGNGMIIDNISVLGVGSENTNYLGLFASLNNAVVSNLTIRVNQVLGTQSYAVGALAGSITGNEDSNNENLGSFVNNINVLPYDSDAEVSGYNITGGIIGIASGKYRLANLSSNVSVYTRCDESQVINITYYSYSDNSIQNNISYAGGVVGVLTQKEGFAENRDSPKVINCTSEGAASIQGFIVGGVFGFVDSNVVVSNSKYYISDDAAQTLNADRIAGGLVGENRGLILYSYISMEENLQDASDILLSETSVVQNLKTTLFGGTPVVIGGLVGLNVGTSGIEVENQTGGIEYCYSRVNVTNNNATVAGGVVGLSISNINELLIGLQQYVAKTNQKSYGAASTISYSSSFNDISLYINSVYSTGDVLAKDFAGGFVGVASAPICGIYDSSALTIIPNSVSSEDMAGSIVGKMLFTTQINGITTDSLLFINNDKSAISSLVVSKSIQDSTEQDNTDKLVGNNIKIYEPRAVDTHSLTLTSIAENTQRLSVAFSNFKSTDHSSSKWSFDENLESFIFPKLATGKSVVVQDIATVDEFFEYIKGGMGGNYRIIEDLEFNLKNPTIFNKLKGLSTEQTPIGGSIFGYGNQGSAITITVKYNNEAIPFFGYISGLELSNINFVFVNNALATQSDYFGLLASTIRNSSLSKINILTKQESLNYIITPNNHKAFGAIAGLSSGTTFRNIVSDVSFVNEDYKLNNNKLSASGLVGQCEIRNTFESLTVNTNIKINSAEQGKICIGGIVGDAGGILTISAYGNARNKISGELEVESPSKIKLGGVLGNAGSQISSCTIDKLIVNISKINACGLIQNESETTAGQEVFVGGVVGEATFTSIANTNVNIEAFNVSGTKNIYAGGIVGNYKSRINLEEKLITTSNNLTNTNAKIKLNITATMKAENQVIKVGGVVGELYNEVVGTESSKLVETSVYENNFASGTIVLTLQEESQATTLFTGGLVGKIYNNFGIIDGNEYLGKLIKLTNFASDVNIDVFNFTDVNMGGIAGYSSMYIDGSINYGMLNAVLEGSNKPENLNMGGIVGLSKNIISNVLSLGGISSYGFECENKNMQAIVGLLEGTSDVNVIGSYYSADLTGVLQTKNIITSNKVANINNLTLQQILSHKSPNNNWIFGASINGFKCLPFISALTNLMEVYVMESENGIIVSVDENSNMLLKIAEDYETLISLLQNENNGKKSIFLNGDFEVNNLTLKNVARIVGNGSMITTNNYVFTEIPKGVVVTGIIVSQESEIKKQVSLSSLTYGALAPTNNGVVSNCALGGLPDYTQNSSTIATISNGLYEKQEKSMEDGVFTISLAGNVDSNSIIKFGGLAGQNFGLITNSWGYLDVNINITGLNVGNIYIGGLVGENVGQVDYAYSMGKINIENIVYQNVDNITTYVGGVVGVTTTTITNLISYVDVKNSIEEFEVGGVLGFGYAGEGVIFANDMGRSEVFTNQNNEGALEKLYVAKGFSTVSLLGNTSIKNLGLNTNIWMIDETLNYGLVTLKTSYIRNLKNGVLQDIRFTGNGGEPDITEDAVLSPYEIVNFALLQNFVSRTNTDNKVYALTRDLSATKTIGSGGAVNNILYGNGFTIFVSNLETIKSGSTYTLFNIQLVGDVNKTVGKLDRVMVQIGKNNVENASIIAPLVKEVQGGIVTGCAVVGVINIKNGSGRIGGMIGTVGFGTVTNSWTDVTINITNGSFEVGGLVGTMGKESAVASLEKSFASGSITSSGGTNKIGGLVGHVVGTISNRTAGVVYYASSIKIDSCYYSGLTKNTSVGISTISSTSTNKNVCFGAFIGLVGTTSSSDKLTVERLLISNCYFGGHLSSYNENTLVVVGSGKTEQSPQFSGLFVASPSTNKWSTSWAERKTHTGIRSLTEEDIGKNFNCTNSGVKPFLKEVTPLDRQTDNTTEY